MHNLAADFQMMHLKLTFLICSAFSYQNSFMLITLTKIDIQILLWKISKLHISKLVEPPTLHEQNSPSVVCAMQIDYVRLED